MAFELKPEDRPAPATDVEHDTTAIALELKDLGAIEAKILMLNGDLGESRQATREALNLIDSPKVRRLLNRSLRAQDDAVKKGLSVVEMARSL